MKPLEGPLLYEGKAKRVFASNHQEKVLVEFKNDATAFNALKHSEFADKGRLNCQISGALFEFLESKGVPTHFIELHSSTWMFAHRVQIIPLEVVIRNIATGSLCRETPIKEGVSIEPALLDLYYKDDALGDPLLTINRLELLGIVTPAQLSEIKKIAILVNDLLKTYFKDLDLLLVDFKVEFGLDRNGKILLADEISPDTCRLWDQRTVDKKDRILDKDRFRKDLGGVIEAYREILKRIQGSPFKAHSSS